MLLISISPHSCSGACGIPNFISAECATTPVFSPQSKAQLKSAVDAHIKLCPQGDCSNGPHGPIGEWDVSRVTDMSGMFSRARLFNGDVSKWDVSSVQEMDGMFYKA